MRRSISPGAADQARRGWRSDAAPRSPREFRLGRLHENGDFRQRGVVLGEAIEAIGDGSDLRLTGGIALGQHLQENWAPSTRLAACARRLCSSFSARHSSFEKPSVCSSPNLPLQLLTLGGQGLNAAAGGVERRPGFAPVAPGGGDFRQQGSSLACASSSARCASLRSSD
jgi:hypothetical protein